MLIIQDNINHMKTNRKSKQHFVRLIHVSLKSDFHLPKKFVLFTSMKALYFKNDEKMEFVSS